MTGDRLRDKVVLVTGAARGIGRAVALGFAAEGADLIIADVRGDLAHTTADDVQKLGRQALALEVDVSDVRQIERMVIISARHFGHIDVLHNNAGIVGDKLDLFAYTPDDWDRILHINLRAAFFASQRVAQLMIERGRGGRILNTASTSAFIASGMPIVPYDVSKAGLRQLTTSLAVHLAQYRITVNAIAPGTVETEFGTTLPSDEVARARRRRNYLDRVPLGRVAQPQDVVGAAVFLCSDEAAYITGHTLVVDGGRLAG